MKFSSKYEKRQAVPNQRVQKKKRQMNPTLLTILVALILALLCLLTAFLVQHFRKKEVAQKNPPQSSITTDEANTTVPTAPQTPTEPAPSQQIGDVQIWPYSIDMYSTTVTLNVRSTPDASGGKIGMVGQEEPIHVTGHCSNGWYRVDLKGTTGYVSGKYLVEAPTLKEPSKSPYYIMVNRKQNLVTVYEKNEKGEYQKPVQAFACSVGLEDKTPTGTFVTTNQYTWRMLSGNVYGQYATRIDGPYLFHSVPYEKQDKSTLEYEEYNKLGAPASLGCVRLSVEDAKWIFDNCPSGTVVKIYDSDAKEPLAKPTPLRVDVTDTAKRGWDPTDPDANNPWKK